MEEVKSQRIENKNKMDVSSSAEKSSQQDENEMVIDKNEKKQGMH